MWKKLNNSNFFISHTEDYAIYVTDFVTIWFSYITKNSFLRCLKECNSFLEMSDEALIQKGNKLLSYPDSLKKLDTKFEEKTLIITMTMHFGYPFKLNLKLHEGSKELFFQKITQPFLSTILELKNSQLELCQLLKKKDSEIEEYKYEGGEIALKHLKTKPFNEQGTLSKYKSFEEHFGSTNDMICGLTGMLVENPECIKNIKSELPEACKLEPMPNVASIKEEPLTETVVDKTIKEEPSSENMSIKTDLNSQIADGQHSSSVSSTFNIKHESSISIKRESQSIPSIRRKTKKIF